MITPEEFAAGFAQAMGKLPTQSQPSVIERMVTDIIKSWPPPRIEPYPRLQQNDPLVVRYLTELFGPMLSDHEATQVERKHVRAAMGRERPYLYWERQGVPYGGTGQYAAVWASADHAWRLVYESGKLDYECYRRPSDADLAKFCFVIGWFQIRGDNHFYRYAPELWRRGSINSWEGQRSTTDKKVRRPPWHLGEASR